MLIAITSAQTNRWRTGALAGLAGTVQFLLAFHWAYQAIVDTTNAGEVGSGFVYLGLILWESLAIALFGFFAVLLAHHVTSSLWLLIPLWLVIESVWPKIFPWSVAHTYLDYLPLMQLAELAGTTGVAAVVMVVNVLLAQLLLQSRFASYVAPEYESGQDATSVLSEHTLLNVIPGSHGGSLLALILLIAVAVWGWLRGDHYEQVLGDTSLRVALVQVDPSNVGSCEALCELSDAQQGPIDLYVWPESALGIYDAKLPDFREELRTIELSESPNPAVHPYPNNPSFLLAGAKTYDDGGRGQGPYRNVALLIDADKSIRGRTVKRTLMPIGEYLPYGNWLPQLRELAALDTELVRGTESHPLTMPGGTRIGALVCYEEMDAQVAAESVRSGANLLVSLVNASAFTSATTHDQHLRLARLRAVENRRWLLRCSATGISCAISPAGRIVEQLPRNESGAFVVDVNTLAEVTWFSRTGQWSSALPACILLAAVGWAGVRRISAGFAASRAHGDLPLAESPTYATT